MKNKSLKILIAEDDLSSRELLIHSIKGSKSFYSSIVEASSLEESLSLMEKHKFDAILLDLNLDDSRGIKTLELVQTKAPNIPILVITGSYGEEMWKKAIALGAEDYLLKGDFLPKDLERSVRYAVERKQVENELFKTRNTLQQYLSVAGVILVAIDKKGKVVLVNRKGCEILGYDRKEMVGKNWFDNFVPSNVREKTREFFKNMLAGKTDFVREHQNTVLTKSGEERTIAWYNVSVCDDDGTILSTLSSGEDITERLKAKDALVKTEERYRDLFEKSKDGIIVTSIDGKVLEFNQTALKIFGYTAEDAENIDVKDMYATPEGRERFAKNISKDGFLVDFEENFVRKDGEIITCLLTANLWKSETGEVLGYQSILRDITEKKKNEEKLSNYIDKLQKTMQSSIKAMSIMTDFKDPYTAGHEQRVSQLATAIAKKMGLDDDEISVVHMASSVHDLGKIAIPAKILVNPGKLDYTEFELIKQHPQIGYEILKNVDFPWPIASIVLQHHERLDGSGYPDGLSENEIFLGAKILAVADVVEAIASHRPYRAALGVDIAVDEIISGKGEKYDHKVVDACLELIRNENFTFDHYNGNENM